MTADVSADQLAADAEAALDLLDGIDYEEGSRLDRGIIAARDAVAALVARLEAAERALQLADEDHDITERHNLARAEAAERERDDWHGLFIKAMEKTVAAEAALGDTRQALREVWEAAEALTNPDLVTTGEASEHIAAVRMTRAVERARALAGGDATPR